MAKAGKKADTATLNLLDVTGKLKTAPCVPSLRVAVKMWRDGGYKGATATTRKLLRYWFATDHRTASGDRFQYHEAQREAVETLIFVWEYEKVLTRKGLLERYATDLKGVPLPEGGDWPRYALKMATGSGKTKVMAMVMAWQLLNAAAEPPHIAKHYARTVLLIAPGLIVFERLRTDFGAGRIFHTDPVIPKELEVYWDLGVVERGDGLRPDSESMLYFTNVDQLYEGKDAPSAEPDAMTAVLGPKAPLKKLDPTDFEERIALRDGPVMVINDEAHHAWPGSKWDEVIGRVAKRSTLALQVDLSATPRLPKTGTLFPWTIYDYPLKQAILHGIVKRPVRGIAKIAEVNSANASVRYAGFLTAGVERWREYRAQLSPLGKRPLIFVMLNDTSDADEVADWLMTKYPEEFAGARTLVIHTNSAGEITKGDLDKAREAARAVDEDKSPVNAIVSVMMLREGWDVSNVTVVLGLRPFSSKTNILPEQAVGRGLRLMFRGTHGYTERVDIMGTPKFMEFIEDLEKNEDIKIGSFEVGKDKLKIQTIAPDPTRGEFELVLPEISPVLVRKKSIAEEIASLDVHGFTLPDVTLSIVPTEVKTFVYEGRDIITNATEFVREYAVPVPQTAQEVIGYYARRIGEQVKLPAHFAAIAVKLREFFEERAFKQKVDLGDPAVVRAISTPVARFVTEKAFTNALAKLAIAEREPELLSEGRGLSSCAPFPWSGQVHAAQKTIFNLLPCDNNFELEFSKWLDHSEEVVSFAKLPMRFGFAIEYIDDEFSLRSYYPDFVARGADGTLYILETKGLESPEVVHKDRAARLWCENVTTLTGKPWRYLKVPQKTFGQLQPTSLGELVALSASGSMKGTLTLPGIVPVNAPATAPRSEFRAFLDEVYGLVAAGSERKALTRIFDFCDELVLAENFSSCSAVLKEVDLDRLEATTALGFLSITNAAKERLPDRPQYLDRVATMLSRTRTEDYVDGLLRGLR